VLTRKQAARAGGMCSLRRALAILVWNRAQLSGRDMTSSALLTTYREVRDAISGIHDAADAVGACLDRVQIYGECGQLPTALSGTRELFCRVQALERTLGSCAELINPFISKRTFKQRT